MSSRLSGWSVAVLAVVLHVAPAQAQQCVSANSTAGTWLTVVDNYVGSAQASVASTLTAVATPSPLNLLQATSDLASLTVNATAMNIFSGFDAEVIAEAFNVDTEVALQLQTQGDMRGAIVRVQAGLPLVIPTVADINAMNDSLSELTDLRASLPAFCP
ncbi:hypothetical protein [Myxococcus sp. AB025B]|uniref:hypothetical protein n=1 Tax=Myxococcus sp. AB025B TaxID=2562794 RepID=UPI0011415B60|nr:hypothetical protein [Myxococcus sp. AB025B]